MDSFPDLASNAPLATPDIKFGLNYARKLNFGLLSPYMEIWPQAPRNKKFFFLESSTDFTSNEPSTTPDYKFRPNEGRKLDFGSTPPKMNPHKWKFDPRPHFIEKTLKI